MSGSVALIAHAQETHSLPRVFLSLSNLIHVQDVYDSLPAISSAIGVSEGCSKHKLQAVILQKNDYRLTVNTKVSGLSLT